MNNISDMITVAKSEIDAIMANLQQRIASMETSDPVKSNPNEPRAGYVIDLSEPQKNKS